ncbi:MAG TPA: 1,2-phenylacetyl-CoA epoxidase subunit B [Phycisphaerae bacterium]|nr:1,2-phenylacetyl-CoA epoxidase subunit B [Phycisphaerae bacterium]HRW56039.1 1,2-phenylacetyl-CoA epoxidase subunit B [Phycisphaerae bacterium]
MSDTQWSVFEVFHQPVRGEPHVHVGSVHAPDAETAILMAKEQFARRQACVNIWVVAAEAITATPYEDADIFEHGTDKSYREAFGYETTKRAKAVGDSADL